LAVVHNFTKSRAFYGLVFVGCALPGLAFASDVWRGHLGANPVESLEHATGQDALTILLVTLCVTPIRRLTGWNRVQRVRRMLGLWSFAYAVAHVSIYVAFDQACTSWAACHLGAIWADVLKRKFIFAGASAFLLLVPLAATSTKGMTRRLGRLWTPLHRLIYAAACAAIVHFFWSQKSNVTKPLPWTIWLAALLGFRVFFRVGQRFRKRASL
jgi:sulfoxide reductase heme-binding subunit YedZ